MLFILNRQNKLCERAQGSFPPTFVLPVAEISLSMCDKMIWLALFTVLQSGAWTSPILPTGVPTVSTIQFGTNSQSTIAVATRVGVDYKSPITITVPIKLSITITITITVVIEKAITITITIIRLRLQLLVYHGNDSRLFIRHVHLQYYHA